jgi:hypothetical protein
MAFGLCLSYCNNGSYFVLLIIARNVCNMEVAIDNSLFSVGDLCYCRCVRTFQHLHR